MQTPMILKAMAVGALAVSSQVIAAGFDRPVLASHQSPASCSCKHAGECTCPKGECKCKACGKGDKARLFEALKANGDSTRLPDTARLEDARGGVFI